MNNLNSITDKKQGGAALMVALVMLLILTVIGVTAIRTTTLQERMAGNMRDANLAFQAAEAGLRDGEALVRGAVLPPFDGTAGLLQVEPDAGRTAYWNAYNWAGNSRVTAGVDGVAALPNYVVEELPPVPVEGGSERFGPLPDVGFYRVTARGVGGTTDAVSILQTVYRR
jgi:type IV pilus assembly protein PilX